MTMKSISSIRCAAAFSVFTAMAITTAVPAYAVPAQEIPTYTATIENISGRWHYTAEQGIALGLLVPGDTWTYHVTTRNLTLETIRYQLTEASSDITDRRLFDRLDLTITDGSNTLYQGRLSGAAFPALEVNPLSARTLLYSWSFPIDSDNDTQGAPLSMHFHYYAESVESTASADDNASAGDGGKPGGNDGGRAGSDGSFGSSRGGTGFHGDVTAAVYTGGSMHLYPDPSVQNPLLSDGEWVPVDAENRIWNYRVGNEIVKNGWICVKNPWSGTDKESRNWYYFYDNGQMAYGWLKDAEDNWYFLHEISDGDLGTLVTGWHEDRDDGFTYYLDPLTGRMCRGWQEIDGRYYYFAEAREIAGFNWFFQKVDELDKSHVFGWFFRSLNRRTYGSMYRDEQTPDGSTVGPDGAKVMPSKGVPTL